MAAPPNIPGYRLLKVLKESKRSRTFLAEQQSLARQVAVKVLSEEFFKDASFRQRFIDEGKSAAKLNHPHILAVFDIGSVGGYPFIATEFVGGGTLRDRIQGPLFPDDALRIARELALALDYAHSQGVSHRDIKPSNILFRQDGGAVLADLGILRSQSNQTAMVGSPHYMSPEQLSGEAGDGRSDLYSLGVVLFEMLTGKTPFDADDPFQVATKHLMEPVPRLPDGLKVYQPIIDKALAKAPGERYATAKDFAAALETLIQPITLRTQNQAAPGKPAAPAEQATLSIRAPAPAPSGAETLPASALPQTQIQQAVSESRLSAPPTAAPAPAAAPARPGLRDPAHKPRPRWPALLVILILLGVAIWALLRWLGADASDSVGAVDPRAAQERQLAGTEAMPPVEEAVKALIAEGDRYLAAGQLLSPPQSNAYAVFRSVLVQDSRNPVAQQKLEEIAQRLEAQIQQAIDAGDRDGAMALVQAAQVAYPGRESFKSMQGALAANQP